MKQKTQLEAYCSLPGGKIIFSGASVVGDCSHEIKRHSLEGKL